jgi:hypothetical protein
VGEVAAVASPSREGASGCNSVGLIDVLSCYRASRGQE